MGIITPLFADHYRIGWRLELPALRADGTEFRAELAINRTAT